MKVKIAAEIGPEVKLKGLVSIKILHNSKF